MAAAALGICGMGICFLEELFRDVRPETYIYNVIASDKFDSDLGDCPGAKGVYVTFEPERKFEASP